MEMNGSLVCGLCWLVSSSKQTWYFQVTWSSSSVLTNLAPFLLAVTGIFLVSALSFFMHTTLFGFHLLIT